jgi:3-phenylpropionate/trans-cinnamate dioxygenase ferredoxin component
MSFARACGTAEVAVGTARATVVDGVPVAVVLTDEGWFAIHDVCSHAEVPLSNGDVDDCHIECYMHGSRFDLRTGVPDQLPATVPVPVYPISIDGDDVLVDVANPHHFEEN